MAAKLNFEKGGIHFDDYVKIKNAIFGRNKPGESKYPHGIDTLVLIDGEYRKPLEPHEDIHHPDYFDAKNEYDKYYSCLWL